MINEDVFRIKKDGKPYSGCFCTKPELIENYDKAIADTTQTWDCHHRKEELYSQKELKTLGLYYDVSPEDLIFLTQAEHNKIDSACKRISEAKKGKTFSEEHKRKIGKAMKNNESLSKKVLCVETGEIFVSAMEAYRQTGITNIIKVCNGKRKTAGKLHWKYL